MDKRLKYCCASCVFLDKENKIDEEFCYSYGCLRTPRKRIVGWMHSDSELKTMGCSDWCKLPVGAKFIIKSLFTDKQETYLYCGMVDGKPLLYGKIERKYRIVSKDCLRAQTGALKTNVKIVQQNETQFEASKRVAKKRRKRYIEQNCNRN